MKDSSLKTILPYLLIIGIGLSMISQVVPWGILGPDISSGIEWYSWGVHGYLIDGGSEWIDFFTEEHKMVFPEGADLAGLIRFTFPMNMISILLVAIAMYRYEKYSIKSSSKGSIKSGYIECLSAGIISLLSIIFYAIAINDITTSTGVSGLYHWYIGFFLSISAIAIFFISAGMIYSGKK